MNAIDIAQNYSDSIEVDLESELFKVKDKKNPDSEKYIKGKKGEWLLKPRQCFCCLKLFTPECEGENFCSDCKERRFCMSDIKLKPCEIEGCPNTVKGKRRFCDSCNATKKLERDKRVRAEKKAKKGNFTISSDTFDITSGNKDVGSKINTNHEIRMHDSPMEKLIKSTFFLFQDDIKCVKFVMKNDEVFKISKE